MTESRINNLENRLDKLEKDRNYMVNHLQDLQLQLEKLQKPTPAITSDLPSTHAKIDYLAAANEQMFKQNQRLRQYIEECISGEKSLDQKSYLRALSGEE